MNKLAIFVEGQTEQIFVEQLIKESAGEKKVTITKIKISGGKRRNRPGIINIAAEYRNTQYFILLFDCGNDENVRSRILEQHDMLAKQGFQKVIGIRDVYPQASYVEIPRLRHGLSARLPTTKPDILFLLGIMEIEAWLIAEYTHFPKINPKITADRIKSELGIDVVNDDLSQRIHPAKDLSDIYWLEKFRYDKSYATVTHIISSLDVFSLKTRVSQKFNDLQILYTELDLFFG